MAVELTVTYDVGTEQTTDGVTSSSATHFKVYTFKAGETVDPAQRIIAETNVAVEFLLTQQNVIGYGISWTP